MVSVIITTRNNERTIGKCIESIKDSSHKDIEILVIDNYSSDDTVRIALKLGVRVISCGPERSAQRNRGMQLSTGDYLLFLDSDMEINRYMIEHCLWMINTKGVDALYIEEMIIGHGYWNRVRNLERSFYSGTRIDAVRFVKKSCCPKFDEQMTGVEDWDWDRRIKGKKDLCPYPIYHNEEDFNVVKYIRKKSYYCNWVDLYRQRHGNCPELSFIYRSIGVFIEQGRWWKVLYWPHLFAGIVFLKLAVGAAYLCRKRS